MKSLMFILSRRADRHRHAAALVLIGLVAGAWAAAQTLHIEVVQGQPRLRWRSLPGERYRIETTQDLRQPFTPATTELTATPPTNVWQHAGPVPPRAFYRIKLTVDPAATNWWQHAHDAMRTGYAPLAPPHPWRWAWQWNGSDGQGRIAPNKIHLPRNVQPVVAEGRVFIAAGVHGLIALNADTGTELWRVQPGGALNSTPAYDPLTGRVLVVSSNGNLYRVVPQTGAVDRTIPLGPPSPLPLPPALHRGVLWATMGDRLVAYDTWEDRVLWTHVAPARFDTPPAYSPRHNLVVACDEQLYVVAVSHRDGSLLWRRRASGHEPQPDQTTYAMGWPVIAEDHELVLLRLRIPWDYLWLNPNPFEVPENAVIRQRLNAAPLARCHFALRLRDGTVAFDVNNGAGGFGDGGYLPMGSMPIVRRMPDGREIALNIIRGDPRYDARWDSHFGEIMLDDETIPGLQAGDVRWIRHGNGPNDDAFLLTDEQPFLSAAGDYLFGSHWLVTYAIRPLDRSAQYGTFSNKIDSQNLSWMIVSQGRCGPCAFSPTHYCAQGLYEDPGCGRGYAPGFYVCYDAAVNGVPVQDLYWTEYGCVVGLPDRLIIRDTTGAIFCLVNGDPLAPMSEGASLRSGPAGLEDDQSVGLPVFATPIGQSDPAEPEMMKGAHSEPAPMPDTLSGELRYIFNNGRQILLAFAEPHQGTPKVLIEREHWAAFEGLGTEIGRNRALLWKEGDRIEATGRPGYYQGDPVIRVHSPDDIRRISSPAHAGEEFQTRAGD